MLGLSSYQPSNLKGTPMNRHIAEHTAFQAQHSTPDIKRSCIAILDTVAKCGTANVDYLQSDIHVMRLTVNAVTRLERAITNITHLSDILKNPADFERSGE